eukprot:Pgem_evm1s15618
MLVCSGLTLVSVLVWPFLFVTVPVLVVEAGLTYQCKKKLKGCRRELQYRRDVCFERDENNATLF